jgi:hypothetical protein
MVLPVETKIRNVTADAVGVRLMMRELSGGLRTFAAVT